MAPPVVKLKFNIISYFCTPTIDCNNFFYLLYVLKSTFHFLIVKRKNLSFWSTRKIHFLKFEEKFVKTPQILIWKLSDGQIGLVHTANLSGISCTFISCYIYTLSQGHLCFFQLSGALSYANAMEISTFNSSFNQWNHINKFQLVYCIWFNWKKCRRSKISIELAYNGA